MLINEQCGDSHKEELFVTYVMVSELSLLLQEKQGCSWIKSVGHPSASKVNGDTMDL